MNEMSIPRSMVRQLLGASRFDSLAPSLQRMHTREGRYRYSGEVDVVRGRGLLARLCAWATCLPAQGHGTMHVEIFANHHGEQWTRRYCGRSMRSRLWVKNGLLYERLGLVTFVFRLEAEDHAITWHVQRVRALGVPLPVRWFSQVHAREGRYRYSGEVDVVRGRGLLARLCAWATCLPAQGHGTMHVEIFANHQGEQWTRRYCGRSMRSRLWVKNGLLYERLGLVTFVFRLEAEDHAITWHVQRVRALGVPLPVRWFSQVHAREYEQDGRYRYEVNAALPLTGMLVRYRGSLDVG